MGLFKKRDRVIDLAERYRKQQEQASQIKEEIIEERKKDISVSDQNSGGVFSFLGNMASNSTSTSNSEDFDNSSPEQRKRRLAKRLMDMTEKIEDLTNQIYHLQQRLEVIERKININRV